MDIAFLSFLVLLMFGGHALADYGLQSAHVAEKKVQGDDNPDWFITLSAHCLMHGIVVAIVVFGAALIIDVPVKQAIMLASGLGWAETIAHFIIDRAKGAKKLSYRTDQALHYGSKLLWISVMSNTLL